MEINVPELPTPGEIHEEIRILKARIGELRQLAKLAEVQAISRSLRHASEPAAAVELMTLKPRLEAAHPVG